MDMGIRGRHVLITGASGGIGFECTRAFLQEGARVSATYCTSKKQLTELESSWGEQLAVIRVDICDESQVSALFHSAVERFGRVDILVANAGIAHHEGKAIQDLGLDQWQETISVNLTGAFLSAKYFFLNLEEKSGDNASLILIGSTAGYFGEAWYCDYSASKAGMHGLLMSLKNEIVHVARKGRVNLVNPGWTRTPMAEGALNDTDMMKRILQTVPLRKVAQPSDIANTILYLSSDQLSGHVSGATINVAGGMEGRVLFLPEELNAPRT
ncbi:MAG: SDR family oxidoreductase [Candidatus Thorarchaeota archaeon]|nr:SDR family oxidoreductase [Candidatus Thorarchaeota archaeon]